MSGVNQPLEDPRLSQILDVAGSDIRQAEALTSTPCGDRELGAQHGEPEPVVDPTLCCAWCVPQHVIRSGGPVISHGICPLAKARIDAELLALEAINQAVFGGLGPMPARS